jgi:hypothetical protein
MKVASFIVYSVGIFCSGTLFGIIITLFAVGQAIGG